MNKFMVAVHYEEGLLFAVEAENAEEAKGKVMEIIDGDAEVVIENNELIRQKVVHRDVMHVETKEI
jgi:hypothetical protein